MKRTVGSKWSESITTKEGLKELERFLISQPELALVSPTPQRDMGFNHPSMPSYVDKTFRGTLKAEKLVLLRIALCTCAHYLDATRLEGLTQEDWNKMRKESEDEKRIEDEQESWKRAHTKEERNRLRITLKYFQGEDFELCEQLGRSKCAMLIRLAGIEKRMGASIVGTVKRRGRKFSS